MIPSSTAGFLYVFRPKSESTLKLIRGCIFITSQSHFRKLAQLAAIREEGRREGYRLGAWQLRLCLTCCLQFFGFVLFWGDLFLKMFGFLPECRLVQGGCECLTSCLQDEPSPARPVGSFLHSHWSSRRRDICLSVFVFGDASVFVFSSLCICIFTCICISFELIIVFVR